MAGPLGIVRFKDLAAIRYLGDEGDSRSCLEAVQHVVQVGESLQSALLLTAGGTHCLLLRFEVSSPIAVKSGFTSGYRGTGPNALADAICLLEAARVDMEEIEVDRELLERLNASALTHEDLSQLETARYVRPTRIYQYVYDLPEPSERQEAVWTQFPAVMPWSILDNRIIDLAQTFFAAPDKAIMDGFRRLEDRVRERTALDEHGSKLFSQAFVGDKSILAWTKKNDDIEARPKLIDTGEQTGRALLFTGAFQAFRNPRAHCSPDDSDAEALSEVLVLNQLFMFERSAVLRRELDSGESNPAEP